MGLNHGQQLQLSIGYTVAVRTTYFVDALLGLYQQTQEASSPELGEASRKLREFRAIARAIAERFALEGEPRDLRPIIVDQVYRARDALHPDLVAELENFGPLDQRDEAFLRQQLSTLLLLTREIARCIQRLPPCLR